MSKEAEVEVEAKAPELSPAEVKARDSGWRPADEWNGDADAWVDYKEFNFRGELMSRINEQSGIINTYKRKVEDQGQAIEDTKEFIKTISEREYNKALKALKAEKIEAIESGESVRVIEIDDEIDELKGQRAKADEAPPPREAGPTEIPEITAWMAAPENQWYNQDETMRAIANGIADNIRQNNSHLTPSQWLSKMDAQMRKELPHRFPNKSRVDQGEGNYNGSNDANRSSSKKLKFSDLSEAEQEVCRRFERTKVMTRDEYMEGIAEIPTGEL